MAYNKINMLRRNLKVLEIVNANYVPGVGTYSEIWRKYVNPLYPMAYHTFLRIINSPVPKLLKEEEARIHGTSTTSEPEDDRQLKLFE